VGVKEDVMAPEAAVQVVPAVVVVVTDTNTRLPSGLSQARTFRHVREGAIPIVLEQVRGRRFTRRPARAEPVTVRQVDVQPAVVIVVEKGEAASLGFHNVSLVFYATPDVGHVQTSFSGYIHKRNRRSAL